MGEEPMPVFVFGCIACGKTVAGTERSCPRCGASFDEVKFECPFCGELISPTQRKCESCGTEFGSFSEDVSEASAVDLDGEDSTGAPALAPQSGPAPNGEAPAESMEFECPACGKHVQESDAKCPHCGVPFQ
jgi:predicted amidophosphoribosyltransferase